MTTKADENAEETTATSAAPTRVELPPETPNEIRTRRAIVFSFWAVIICLGLPFWFYTTSIHRAELPLQRMIDFSEGRSCQLRYPVHIQFNTTQDSLNVATSVATKLEAGLNQILDFRLFDFHVIPPKVGAQLISSTPVLTVNFLGIGSADRPTASLRSWEPVIDIVPSRTADHDSLVSLVADQVAKCFLPEQQSLSHLLGDTPFSTGNESLLEPPTREKLDARTTRSFKYASNYHLTFSLFTSSHKPSAWRIESALKKYMQPLLASLSSVTQFTIDTQVQLHAAFSPSISGPVYNNETAQWTLDKSDLSGFINAAEWPLSPSIGTGPTINFVLYVPSAELSPLVIAETGGNSWLIPQWGAVQILNRAEQDSNELSEADLIPVVSLFAEQLTALLGIPDAPPSFSLRTASLARERTTSLILSASSTLGALARLTLKLTSIAIPDSVAKSVDETIRRLDMACENIREGRYAAALENARVAEAEAESAFFEPSMVGQVYFPDEHKVAVYVPLLGPMAVPLVMAALKELRSLRARKQKTS